MLQHLHHHWLYGRHFHQRKALLQQLFKLPISGNKEKHNTIIESSFLLALTALRSGSIRTTPGLTGLHPCPLQWRRLAPSASLEARRRQTGGTPAAGSREGRGRAERTAASAAGCHSPSAVKKGNNNSYIWTVRVRWTHSPPYWNIFHF